MKIGTVSLKRYCAYLFSVISQKEKIRWLYIM